MRYFLPVFTVVIMASSTTLFAKTDFNSPYKIAEFINPYAMNLKMLGEFDELKDDAEQTEKIVNEKGNDETSKPIEIISEEPAAIEKHDEQQNENNVAHNVDRKSNISEGKSVKEILQSRDTKKSGVIEGSDYTIYHDGEYKPGDNMLTDETRNLLIVNGVNPDGEQWKEISFDDKKAMLDKFTKEQNKKDYIKKKRQDILKIRY